MEVKIGETDKGYSFVFYGQEFVGYIMNNKFLDAFDPSEILLELEESGDIKEQISNYLQV